jgi:hypothetical protein
MIMVLGRKYFFSNNQKALHQNMVNRIGKMTSDVVKTTTYN